MHNCETKNIYVMCSVEYNDYDYDGGDVIQVVNVLCLIIFQTQRLNNKTSLYTKTINLQVKNISSQVLVDNRIDPK